ncbi:MAG: tetratricopeptide repeat protein [Bacteroidota bacterium]
MKDTKPHAARTFYEQGKALYEARDYEQAYVRFSRAIGLVEDQGADHIFSVDEWADLYVSRASALLADGSGTRDVDTETFEEALADFEQAVDVQPDKPLLYLIRGRMYLQQGDGKYLSSAQADFERVLDLENNQPEALRYLGESLAKQEKYDEAISFLTQALEQNPNTETILLRGVSFFRQHPPRYAEALRDFTEAQQQMPRLESLYIWRAQCMQEMGHVGEAIAEYDRLIELAPHKPGYLIDRSVLQMAADPDAALADLNTALNMEPHPLAYNNRAVIWRMRGELDAAIADAEAALRTDPGFSIAYATLAEIYAESGDEEALYRYLELALRHYYTDIIEVLEEPAFQPYAAEPRFQELLKAAQK